MKKYFLPGSFVEKDSGMNRIRRVMIDNLLIAIMFMFCICG